MTSSNLANGAPRTLVAIGARRGPDSLDVLVAAAAERADGLELLWPDELPKHFWMTGLGGRERWLSWRVDVARTGRYTITALARLDAGARVILELNGTEVAAGTAALDQWDRIPLGVVEVQDPQAELTLWVDGVGADVKSIELQHEDEWEGYRERLADFRDRSHEAIERFAASGFGLMFQYGPWAYAKDGTRPPLEEHVAAFDVPAFVEWVADTGAGYVLWSATWWTYELSGPATSIDELVGHSGLTSHRDLLGELMDALAERGIPTYLYYHHGHDAHRGYNSTDWWRAQRWPDAFSRRGDSDRNLFIEHLARVIAEMGTRYRERLAGWFFDDAMLLYPGPFEGLARVARAGNPHRLISYNSWIAPRFTDFQDVEFGEEFQPAPDDQDPAARNGINASGPHAQLLGHGMIMLEDDWGVHSPGQLVEPLAISDEELAAKVTSAVERHIPITLNMTLWYPGVPLAESLRRVRTLSGALERARAAESSEQ